MQTELAKLKRRPLLLPLVMPVFLLAVVSLFVVWVLDARTSSVVVIVRHAETEMSTTADPSLNGTGRDRAARLVRMLGQVGDKRGVDAVFASELKRTQQTVMPLAESLGLAVNAVSDAAWNSLARKILREHNGELVLVSADLPAVTKLVEELSGEQVSLRDDEYDQMFIIYLSRLSKARLVRLRY